jgi:DNA-binding NarL/FixJ family response regulator
MKILLADPYEDVRKALRLVLEQHHGFEVVGEVRDTIELMAFFVMDCPDVILLDPDLPGAQLPRRTEGTSFNELLDTLHRMCPKLRVLCLSSKPKAGIEHSMINVDAYFCKSDPPDALLEVLLKYSPPEDKIRTR